MGMNCKLREPSGSGAFAWLPVYSSGAGGSCACWRAEMGC